TEDLDRVVFAVDERLAVSGNAVADLTHLMAELVENAVHFSPPEASVILRTRPYLQAPGAHVLTVEDWGVGMRAEDMAAANEVLTAPQEVDLSVSQRLGLHVVARLAQRHGIEASLTPTPGNGVTAAVVLPASLFSDPDATPDEPPPGEAEVPSQVVPAALAAAVMPAADLSPPPAPPVPPSWAPAERWVDLTEAPAGNGNGNGDGDGYGADWSGWWEPSPGDLEGAEPVSPLAARPPLSERVQAAPPGAWEPHPPGAGAPEREGSQQPGGVPTAVHSPQTHNPLRPAPAGAADGPPLSQRVPQAHLAPELRRDGREGPSAGPEGALPDAAEARAALSRYQASRQAAKAVVDDGGADDGRSGAAGPEPPPGGGGWS
ncbi:MAG TPA: ATP-binding protein, partial [Actinomycetota bacterium]|nr:ATP-binding protein [Actinomycetota bacterium]